MKTISRQALFEDVWTRPLSTIAPEYGLSDVGLRKICDRAGIPTPGRGYWAKVASGRTYPRPRFRPAKDPEHETIYIHGAPAAPPQVQEAVTRLRKVRERARAERSAPAQEQERKEPPPDQEVPAVHRLVRATVTKLAAAKRSGPVRIEGRGLFRLTASAGLVDRIASFLTALLVALEQQGWNVENTDKGFRLLPDGEPLEFEISEQTDKVRHDPTPSEVAALERHEAARKRAAQRGEWLSDWDRPRIPEWEYVPNGQLTFSLATGSYRSDRIRRNFSDGKTQRLECMIDRMMESLAAYAASEKVAREKLEQARLAAIEAEKRREEARRRQELENKRVEFLDAQLKRLRRASEIEALVREIEKEGEPPPAVRAFLGWAREWADELHEELSHETLRAKIERVDLMNDATRIHSWVKVDDA